ncbi:MAG: CopD family protein [Porticoccaceae bacterium]|nr:CopD family protein [Porticoccaceae bacterium]
MYSTILLLHLLGATIWTGGHLYLVLAILPQALKARAPERILAFESSFERVGMSALLVQVATGLWMAMKLQPDLANWFTLATPHAKLIMFKITLLLLTVLTALDVRLRIIPKLSPQTLPSLAVRIVFVTFLSVLFVVAGASFRGALLFGLFL